jgi:hypothetical protein
MLCRTTSDPTDSKKQNPEDRKEAKAGNPDVANISAAWPAS